jgi:hypothetical protein
MESNILIEEKAKTILNEGDRATTLAIGVLQTGEKRKLRIFKSNQNNYCYKAPRKRNYGYPLHTLGLTDLLPYSAIKRKSDEAVWRDSWLKVKERLEKSKLWVDMLNDIKIALDVGYEKLNQANKQYWVDNKEIPAKDKYQENGLMNAKKIQEIDERLVGYSEDINLYARTSIIWYMCQPARVKKMNFGIFNEEKLKHISLCLKKKEACHKRGRKNYDISFEYNPKIQKAWYSEEFKDCGNGHYYLALDATHALFYEDD